MDQNKIDELTGIVKELWQLHLEEKPRFDKVHAYLHDELGKPSLPDGADSEVKAIAEISIKNVLLSVRDTFAQNLEVVGYQDALTGESQEGWDLWQKNHMDARQSEIYTPAVTYGVSYVAVFPGDNGPEFRPRSPRQMLAAYEDSQVDIWPKYALEIWIETIGSQHLRKGLLYTDDAIYGLSLGQAGTAKSYGDGFAPTFSYTLAEGVSADRATHEDKLFHVTPHNLGHPPVVRYVNRRDAEDFAMGEIEPLIPMQRAINAVNFDRMIVSRYGAFPQKVITGWAGSAQEVLAASAKKVWAFDDENVRASTLSAASLEGYTNLLSEMVMHVARSAKVSPVPFTDTISNVSGDTVAALEGEQQRKLSHMRTSFGESHEQLIECGLALLGATPEDQGVEGNSDADLAEIVWADTENRAFAAIVDGVGKLTTAGIPIEELLFYLPGMTQQKITRISRKVKAQRAIEQRLATQQANAATTAAQANSLAPNTPNGNQGNNSRGNPPEGS